MTGARVAGVLLAAGAGRRAGGPKALRHDADGVSWLRRGIEVLRDGGCDEVIVVLGAGASAARELIMDSPVTVAEAIDWRNGMSASLRVGLEAASVHADLACVLLVDLPDVGSSVVSRVLTRQLDRDTLARAAYQGRPGHPVLIGMNHLPALTAELGGDTGAKAYLTGHGAYVVECGDLATGQDRDE